MRITKAEAQIAADVLALVLNDPDWQDMASATDEEWNALVSIQSKLAIKVREKNDIS